MRLEHLLSGAAAQEGCGQQNRKVSVDQEGMRSCITHPVYCFGGLAQLARAPALQAGGQRFESVILHSVTTLPGVSDKKGAHGHIGSKKQRAKKLKTAKLKSNNNDFHEQAKPEVEDRRR